MLLVENLCVVYDQVSPPVPAAMDIGFSLSEGESIGVVGESGCGKTTLALAITGLLTDANVSGTVKFQGRDLNAIKPSRRRLYRWRNIAMVFQNSLEVLNPVITLGEQIAEPLITHLGMVPDAAEIKAGEMLEQVGLDPEWRKGYAHQLSGGMRQRALIAMALACGPDMFIVDEPTASLDPSSRAAILDLIEKLRKQMGFSMIMISHNFPAIQRLTSKLIVMYAGRIVEQGLTAEVLKKPLHPYTRGLLDSSPDFFPYKDLWGIRGAPPKPGRVTGCAFRPRCCQASNQCEKSSPPLVHVGVEHRVACHKGGIETLLRAIGLVKTFRTGDREIKALDGVGLTVRRGEVVALVGESGSGKSTLAHILVDVLRPDKGEVLFMGGPLKNRNATAVSGGVQIVFQDPMEAVSHRFTVLEAVREPLDIMKWKYRRERDRKAVQTLTAMHLPAGPDFLQRTCHALSGGQRQRVAIARALTTDPALLIADEITSMLDPSTQAVILRELKSLQHQKGFSMLFITHDINLARKIADRVFVLERGRMVRHGAVFEMLGLDAEISGSQQNPGRNKRAVNDHYRV